MHWLMVALAARGELPESREAAVTLVSVAEARGHRPALINAVRSVGLLSLLMGRVVEAYEWLERNMKEFVKNASSWAAAMQAVGASSEIAFWSQWRGLRR
jgi:hypothetical protein